MMGPTRFLTLIALPLPASIATAVAIPAIPLDDSSISRPSTVTFRPEDVQTRSYPPLRPGPATSSTTFLALQLNLCNSGYAKCYEDGKSIPEASTHITDTKPNVVSINEICDSDISALQAGMAAAWPNDSTYSVFMPAINLRTGPYECKNGALYGSVVIGKWSGAVGDSVKGFGGLYGSQDGGSEGRIFACAGVTGEGAHFACSTHLSADSKPVALAQCKALLFDAVPYLKSENGLTGGKTVVSGDFNLKYDRGDKNNVQQCVPNGYTRKGDGSVQHVVFSNDLKFDSTEKKGLKHTDHPAFLVKLNS